jgi:GH18 family chitinase
MMTYDQGGGHHSTYKFAKKAAEQGARIFGADVHKLNLGLPLYGRDFRSGEWTTYEDLVQRFHPLKPRVDRVPASGLGDAYIGFNGVDTIYNKTLLAGNYSQQCST